MIQQFVEPVAKLDYRILCESLIRTFGMSEPVNWESSLSAAQQQQLFGGELLRIIADHPTLAQQHDIRALCWPKGTVSQLLFLFVRLNDDRLPKAQIERITRRFVGGLEAERYTVWFFGNPSQTMLKVVLAGREGKKAVCKTLTLEAGQWYKTYDFILDTVAKVNAVPAQRDMFAVNEPSLLWKAIWQAFDISIVNKNFYRDIKTAFDSLVTALSNCKGILSRPEQRAQFAVRLLGRLIFCWFLKKKGIVGSNALSSATVSDSVNYYRELLEPLFFDVFNTPQSARKSGLPESIAGLRFLNGGLFEPQADDCQGNFQLLIPNDWFAGFFGDTMERYNFTVDENSATNAEIAIDPEMLGRIFENLLAEQNPETGASARKQTGSFYTPREIVDYMVEESLIAYLSSVGADCIRPPLVGNANNDANGKFGGNADKGACHAPLQQSLIDFVHTAELAADLKPHTANLLDKLNRLKTIDIAAGSGAFPIGMLQKIVMLKQALNPKASPYDLKLETIENSIYGVDIQPMAIELSRLRCWLSLIVDEEPDKVQPLPNLDFKFVCADSLIDLGYKAFREQCEKKHGFLFLQEFEEKIKELKRIRHDYFDTTHNHNRKQQLKQEFLKVQDEIFKISLDLVKQKLIGSEFTNRITGWNPFDDSKAAPFFSPAWMFGIEDGFDISIGNPPYFNISTVSKETYDYLAANYKVIHTGYNDILYYFIYRGIECLNSNGCCALITSNYYLGNEYAKKLRKHLKTHIEKIVNFKDQMVFDEASIHTCISISSKEATSKDVIFFEAVNDDKISSSDIEAKLQSVVIERTDLNEDWIIANDSASKIIAELNKGSVQLGEISSIAKGSESGKNDVFTLSEDTANKYKIEKNILRKCIKNSHINKYSISYRELYLIYVDNEFAPSDYKNTFDYLNNYKTELLNRRGPLHQEYEWFRLHRPSIKEVFDADEKIVVPYRSESNCFAYDNNQYFNDGGDIRAIIINDRKFKIKYVLAILNSKLMDWYYGFIGKPKGKAREYFNKPLALIPIKKISETEQKTYISLVDKILEAKQKGGEDTRSYEAEIDKLVYALYGLTDEQIAVVEGRA